MLMRYAGDERVATVTGNNFQKGRRRGHASYYFSRYNHCWGWASWRRAWQHYDGNIQFWPVWRTSPGWQRQLPDPAERRYWASIFDRVWRGEIDSWAYPWTASLWYRGQCTVTPNVNLVANIGFGPGATHTKTSRPRSGAKTFPLGALSHPDEMQIDEKADAFAFSHHFGGRNRKWPRKGAVLVWAGIRRCLQMFSLR
jgi:hypothetical protein